MTVCVVMELIFLNTRSIVPVFSSPFLSHLAIAFSGLRHFLDGFERAYYAMFDQDGSLELIID